MTLQLVDSHCHLPLIDHGGRGMAGVIEDAADNGVSHILCVCVDLESYDGVCDAATTHPNVFRSVGVHPNTGPEHEDPTVERLIALAGDPRVVALGETGLDHFRTRGGARWQTARFRTHIRAARETGKPLIVHTRDAAADVIKVLREERADEVGGVMHCFAQDWDTASAAMDLGFYISFSGIVTFRGAEDLRRVAGQVPAERLLIETDAPWLAPVPKRGRQNEPAYVRYTAEFLAELRSTELAALAQTTTDNFFGLFPLATPV
jgi:TatD DNase family protein